MPKKSEEKTSKEEASPEETPKKQSKKISEKDFEKKVIEFAKKGLTSEKIGEELKKQKIHSKEFSKKISKILKENNLYKSPELENTKAKLKKVSEHYEKNKQDKKAKREKDRIFSQLRKVKKYLKVPLK